MKFTKDEVCFTTLTINGWISVFEDFPQTKEIILSCFSQLTIESIAKIYAFVIMRDHIHIIWEIIDKDIMTVIVMFKKYSARKIVDHVKEKEIEYLRNFSSIRKDRKYKVWKNKSGNLRILHKSILNEKLDYIHRNPTIGSYRVCQFEEEYKYSSALSYKTKIKVFSFLTLIDI